MSLHRSRRVPDQTHADSQTSTQPAHPGEPGVGVDLAPPFLATDDPTRWLFSLNRFGIRPGLGRIEGLLTDLGHPERHLRTVVVAGTNGKGSTTRILARLLRDAGHSVATFTSPHLLRVHERIQLDGQSIDAADFAARVTAIRPLTEKHGASWFETLTALAVLHAKESGVDFFCCEAGLGGRLDASNALPSVATLLTTVALDHQRILGDDVVAITAEKLGLLKTGVPLFTGVGRDLCGQVFTAAVTAGSPCYFLDELAHWALDGAGGFADGRETWELALRSRVFGGLPGCGTAVMRRNVALSLLALSELSDTWGEKLMADDPGFSLGNLFLPGRYQQVLADPTWIFDTAHNAQALSATLAAFRQRPCRGRRVILFATMLDKELPPDILGESGELSAGDHLVGLPVSLPRARSSGQLHALFGSWGYNPGASAAMWDQPVTVAETMVGGLAAVVSGLRREDAVLVTGSCFMVAEVMHCIGVTDLKQTRVVRDAAPVLRKLVSDG